MPRKVSKKQTGGKRKLNAYFTLMLNAKKNNLPQFMYKNKKYVQKKLKTGMVVYKHKK